MTNTVPSGTYWADFPVTYRAEEIAAIMRWVTIGESGVVVGGSGVGKSNLMGFLSSRPETIKPHVPDDPERYCFLYLDINKFAVLTIPIFYRGLIQTLRDAAEGLGAEVETAMSQLTQEQVDWDDIFQVLTILQKTHGLVIQQAGKKVVWLLDRFDEACRRLDAQTLGSLRSLRDQFKGRLCYVVATRHPLARLRDPREIDEFHEIVAANTCWVGPMGERDARWIARQMAGRWHTSFSEAEVLQLLEATGGLPAFMKLASSALADGAIAGGGATSTWVEQLLARPEFQRNCQEIWDDLSAEEQNVLIAVSTGANERALEPGPIAYLEQTGLLVRPAPGERVRVFSPILQRFIIRQRGEAAGSLELHPKTRAVLRGGVPLDIELTAQEDRLLSFFLEHPGEICAKDVLIRAVWPDEVIMAGVRDDRLAQLIKRLREKIELDPSRPAYIQTRRGRGYCFVQPRDDSGQ